MRRSRSSNSLAQIDPDPERTFRQLLREQKRRERERQMAQQQQPQRRTLAEFALPDVSDNSGGIVAPNVETQNFEIKPSIIHMVQNNQYGGLPGEDPYAHILGFLNVCATFKIRDVPDDAIRLRLFPFSVRDKAQIWLSSLPTNSITTWDQFKQAFLHKYFPPHKTARLRSDINTFKKAPHETLYTAWERFKELQRQYPHHGLPDWMIPQIFYNGLIDDDRNIINAAAGGKWINKTAVEPTTMLEELAIQSFMEDETSISKGKSVFELDSINIMNAKVDVLTKLISKAQINAVGTSQISCELCGGCHSHSECSYDSTEEANSIQAGFNQRNVPNSNS